MPRNRSEQEPTPPPGASAELLEYLRLEAFGPLEAFLQFGYAENVSEEYYKLSFETRCTYRHALRRAAGLPERPEGVGCTD